MPERQPRDPSWRELCQELGVVLLCRNELECAPGLDPKVAQHAEQRTSPTEDSLAAPTPSGSDQRIAGIKTWLGEVKGSARQADRVVGRERLGRMIRRASMLTTNRERTLGMTTLTPSPLGST